VDLCLAADLAAEGVGDGRAVGVLDVAVVALVAGVEVEQPVGPEYEGVDAVVVVVAAEAGEDQLGLADGPGRVSRIVDRVDPHVGRLGDVEFVAELGDAQRGEQVLVLDEDLVAVADAVVVGVQEDHDSVALGAEPGAAVVGGLTDPDAAALVDVHVGRVDHPRLGGPELGLQPLGDLERLDRLLRRLLRHRGGGAGKQRGKRESPGERDQNETVTSRHHRHSAG
jgi:hypothetical protein